MANRVLLVGAILLVGLTFTAGCGQRSQGGGPTPGNAAPPPEVVVSKPVTRVVTDYFEFPGQTAAVGDVEIRAACDRLPRQSEFRGRSERKEGGSALRDRPAPLRGGARPGPRRIGAAARLAGKGENQRRAKQAAPSVGRRQSGRLRAAQGDSEGPPGVDPDRRGRGARRPAEPGVYQDRVAHRRPRQPHADY